MLIIKPLHVFFNEQNLSLNSTVLQQINLIRKQLDIEFDMVNGPWIAGGAVLKLAEGRALGRRDIDIFFKKKLQFNIMSKKLNEQTELNEEKFDNDNIYKRRSNIYGTASALTYNLDIGQIQLIRRHYYDSVHALLGDFDFTVCQFATDGREIAYTKLALVDMKNKSLRLNYCHKDSTLIRRFYKYMANGYTPLPGQVKLIHEIVREDPFKFANEAGKYGK